MSTWLLDTGPLIAALNRRDPAHVRCTAILGDANGPLLTTGAVVTEAMHFLNAQTGGAAALVEFLDEAQVDIRDCFGQEQLHGAARLMGKYADTPMDFADATLVMLADETGCAEILTLDVRGFRTYRFRSNRRFNLILDSTAR